MIGNHRDIIMAALLCCLLCPVPARSASRSIRPGEQLTLARAIEISLRDNPARLSAASETAAVGERVGQARAALLPQALGGGEYLRATNNPIGATSYLGLPGFPRISGAEPGFQSSATDNNYLLGFSAFQYLLDFGRVRGFVEQRTAEAAAERARLGLADLELIFDTTERYFALLAAQQIVKVYEKAVAERAEHLHESDLKAKAGLVPQIDAFSAQAELDRARVSLLDSQNEVAKAKVALDNTMGLGVGAPDYQLTEILSYHDVAGSIPQYFQLAMRLRPDVKMLEQEARAAGAQIVEYKSDYLPTVEATAGYSARAQGLPTANNLDVGVVITWPIFNGFLTDHQIEEAKLHQDAVRHAIEDLRQRVYLEVEDSFLDWQTSVKRIHRAELALGASRAELELAEKRYNAGLGNIIELTEAERQYTQDDSAYVQALYAFSVSKAAVDRATGQPPSGR